MATRTTWVFLLPEDEAVFQRQLTTAAPGVCWLLHDDRNKSIEPYGDFGQRPRGEAPTAWLHPAAWTADLPRQSAPLPIQYYRPALLGKRILRAGRLAIKWWPDEIEGDPLPFIDAVWKQLRSCTHPWVIGSDNRPARSHRIGPAASRWFLNNPDNRLLDMSNKHIEYTVRIPPSKATP